MSNTPSKQQPAAPLAWWLRALGALPMPLLLTLGSALGWVARVVVRFRRRTVRANLQRCFPALSAGELAATERVHYRNMAQAGTEFARLAHFSAAELCERVRFTNADRLHAELAGGHSLMLLTAHQGNWEWLLQRLAVEFRPDFICAYKPLRNPRLDRELLALRSRFGAQMVPAKGLLRALIRNKRRHVTALAADQMPLSSPARVWLEFMGVPTAFYPGPAEIAARYGYAAWFMAMRRVRPGWYEVEFQPVAAAGEGIDPAEFTARYARCVEAQLRRDPSDWAWGHRRWKLEPPQPPLELDGRGSQP